MSLVQVPVFMAIYRSIPKIDALQSASFLWMRSLSVADPYFVLPLLVFALMYWQQKSQAERAPMPAWIMPSISFLFMTAMPSALVLHSLVSMFLQFGGDRLINRI
jgi:YidC/Oxa1 family membrane protein insertase